MYTCLRVSNQLKKCTLYHTSYSEDGGGIEVHLKNFFDTFGLQGKKIQAQGKATLPCSEVKRMFGVDFRRQDTNTKAMLMSSISQLFCLQVYDRVEEVLMKEDSAASKFLQNPITRVPLATGSFTRTLVQPADCAYPGVLTLQLIGVQNSMFGIRCTLYNAASVEEEGVFLSVNGYLWQFENLENRKKMHLQFIETKPLSNYYLSLIFEQIISEIVQKNLVIKQKDTLPHIKGIQITSMDAATQKVVDVARLETVVSSNDIAKHYLNHQ